VASNTDAIRRLVEDRLAELDKERHELQEALKELTDKLAGKVTGKKSGSRSKSSGRAKSSSGKSGSGRRRRKGGTRADQALKVVADKPGVKASEIAESLKIKPNYVYRVMGDLVKEGRVKKKGTGYFPA
jgi:sugar-specific transcriptional regulator TrmB